MPAYAIFIRDETMDPSELTTYTGKARASLQGHAMTPKVVYGAFEVVEGPPIEGAVVLEFPTMAEAKAWYHSPAYEDAKKHRFAGAKYRAFLIEGVG